VTLRDFLTNGLQVTFGGPVTVTAQQPRAWFVVSVEYVIGPDTNRPPLLCPGTIVVQGVLAESIELTGQQATFKPSGNFRVGFEELRRATASDVPPLCRVVLKCNFLLGGGYKAVDGDFLGGRFPTGDGVAGGDFESWFFLKPDA
jgi:hypothetical protein